jgi:hypothetical protein
MPRLTDIWRTGVVHARMAEIVAAGSVAGRAISWLPAGPPFTFLADPFGIWRDDQLFVFLEAYDYRTRIGGIDVLRFDAAFNLLDRRPCLREPWHLSYPAIIESDGETWMLPEAHRSGTLTLYRAVDFPTRWEAAHMIPLDCVAIDASPIFHDGLWWLFYSPAGDKRAKMSKLHIAFAESLAGPWRPHPLNPVRIDASSSRPGGTPIVVDGRLIIPTQDCRNTYGGAIRMLRVNRLTSDLFDAEADEPIAPPADFAPFNEGLHTLSACGDVTLIDAKRIDRSLGGWAVDLGRIARGLLRRP